MHSCCAKWGDMQLDDIEVLITVSETKSLSQAAEKLFMSRPGLSQKIANIETRYGTKLYERTSTGVVPTPAGVIVTKFAHKISTLESALAAELAATDESFDSTIEASRRSVGPGLCSSRCSQGRRQIGRASCRERV